MLITMNREIMFRQLTDLNLKWIKLIKMMPSLLDVSVIWILTIMLYPPTKTGILESVK